MGKMQFPALQPHGKNGGNIVVRCLADSWSIYTTRVKYLCVHCKRMSGGRCTLTTHNSFHTCAHNEKVCNPARGEQTFYTFETKLILQSCVLYFCHRTLTITTISVYQTHSAPCWQFIECRDMCLFSCILCETLLAIVLALASNNQFQLFRRQKCVKTTWHEFIFVHPAIISRYL